MPRKSQGPTTLEELNSCADELELYDDPISVPEIDAAAVMVGTPSPSAINNNCGREGELTRQALGMGVTWLRKV